MALLYHFWQYRAYFSVRYCLNILKDLKTLHAQYTRVNKRDYLALLDKLVEKYSTDEAAVIHAALLKKCQAGDMDAIRLWTELQKESGSGAAEVNIIDGI